MKKFSIKDLAIQASIAAIYIVLVLILPWISFGPIQARIAEALLVIVFFSNKHMIGLLIGTLIVNLIGSPYPLDWIFGTLATLIVLILLIIGKKLWIPSIIVFPSLINGLVIAGIIAYSANEWSIYGLTALWIGLGELLVVVVLGIPLKLMIERSPSIKSYLQN